MRRFFLRCAAAALAAVLTLPPALAAERDREMVRVGLAYGSGALASANLENNTGYGSGYRLGYFDGDLDFVELARTDEDETQLTMLKTQNTWVNGSSYSSSDNGGDVIGCYHVLVEEGLRSYSQAAREAQAYRDGFVAWIDGDYQVRAGAYPTEAEAEDAAWDLDGEVVGTSSYAVNVTVTGTDQILFQFDGGADTALGVMPDVTGADTVRTWFKGYRYHGGFRYERIGGGDLTVVNIVDLETYIKGVVPYEMSNSWPLEALKVQAVCARSYAYINIQSSKHSPTTAPTGRWTRPPGSTPGTTDRSSRPSTPPATAGPARACTTCGAPLWSSTPICAGSATPMRPMWPARTPIPPGRCPTPAPSWPGGWPTGAMTPPAASSP